MLGRESTQPQIFHKTAVLYGGFTGLALLGSVWGPLQMLPFFTWPYPFLLSVQHFISDPAGGRSWLAGLGLGFVVVLACSRVAQFVLRQKRLTVIQQWAVALLSVVLPLGGVTGIAWGVARAAGWPVGE